MTVVAWYENPGWYALIFSLLSSAVAVAAIFFTRRTAKATIDQSLIRQRNEINDAIMRYSLKGPFATILKISDNELEKFIPQTGILFLQINLLEDVFQHRDILGYARLKSYIAWAETILRPWILSDARLEQVMRLIYETHDLMDKDFVAWMKQIIPVSATVAPTKTSVSS